MTDSREAYIHNPCDFCKNDAGIIYKNCSKGYQLVGVSATLLASGGIRARWSANGTYAYAEVNSDRRISKGIKFPTGGSLVEIVGENDGVLCSFTLHKGSKCRRKRKVDNHGNNSTGTGGGTSGNSDSRDLFNCCMLGLTIMM